MMTAANAKSSFDVNESLFASNGNFLFYSHGSLPAMFKVSMFKPTRRFYRTILKLNEVPIRTFPL